MPDFKIGDEVRVVFTDREIRIGKIIGFQSNHYWPILVTFYDKNGHIEQMPVTSDELRHLLPGEKKKYEEYLSMIALSGEADDQSI